MSERGELLAGRRGLGGAELDKKLASAQQLNSALRQTPRAGGGAEPPRG